MNRPDEIASVDAKRRVVARHPGVHQALGNSGPDGIAPCDRQSTDSGCPRRRERLLEGRRGVRT
jgi:hypothetical protein